MRRHGGRVDAEADFSFRVTPLLFPCSIFRPTCSLFFAEIAGKKPSLICASHPRGPNLRSLFRSLPTLLIPSLFPQFLFFVPKWEKNGEAKKTKQKRTFRVRAWGEKNEEEWLTSTHTHTHSHTQEGPSGGHPKAASSSGLPSFTGFFFLLYGHESMFRRLAVNRSVATALAAFHRTERDPKRASSRLYLLFLEYLCSSTGREREREREREVRVGATQKFL